MSGNELLVAMNGHEVGRLVRRSGGDLSFSYRPTWLEAPQATPLSLSLPLARTPYSGEPVAHFFDNLLPDNEDIRRRIQARFATRSTQPFDLLAAIGADCVGAVQLMQGELPDVRRIEAQAVSDAEIAATLKDYRARPLGMSPEGDFRISIAGAQEKTAFLRREGAWHRPHGPTPTTHIFKLPLGSAPLGIDLSDSVEIEWISLQLAAALGVQVAAAEIWAFEDVKALCVERFDRQWSDDRRWLIRIPQEDMCQALGVSPALKYESEGGPGIGDIMGLLVGAIAPLRDRVAFFRACIAFWLLAAIDGHAKNFSVRLHPGGRFELCPQYDILSVFPLLAVRQLERPKIKMAMAAQGKHRHYRWVDITRRHWLSTAAACRLSQQEVEAMMDDLRDKVDDAVEAVSLQLPASFPDRVATPVLEGVGDAARRLER